MWGRRGRQRKAMPELLLLLLDKVTSSFKGSSKSIVLQNGISLKAASAAEHQLSDKLLLALDKLNCT